jgi:hypothetical protein
MYGGGRQRCADSGPHDRERTSSTNAPSTHDRHRYEAIFAIASAKAANHHPPATGLLP